MDIIEGKAPAGAADFVGRELAGVNVFQNGFSGFDAEECLDFGKCQKGVGFFLIFCSAHDAFSSSEL